MMTEKVKLNNYIKWIRIILIHIHSVILIVMCLPLTNQSLFPFSYLCKMKKDHMKKRNSFEITALVQKI